MPAEERPPNWQQYEDLVGSVALVTGGGRGLGRGFAERMAAMGCAVAVHGSREHGPSEFGEGSTLSATAQEVGAQFGVPTLAVLGDLTVAQDADRVVKEVLAAYGQIDILIHNAGGDTTTAGQKPEPNDAVFVDEAEGMQVLDRNLKAAILVCKRVARHMLERGGQGRIITVSSVAALKVYDEGAQAMYATAKAGLHHYTKHLGEHDRLPTLAPFSLGSTVGLLSPCSGWLEDDLGFTPLALCWQRASCRRTA